MIYFFKCRNHSEDVFYNLFKIMRARGYNCIRLIDEEENNPKGILQQLKGKDFKLITSDHVHISPKNSFSINEIINDLSPKQVYYSIHDLAILDIGYDVKYLNDNFVLLLPGEPWISMYKKICSNIVNIGYPKFISLCEKKNEILFAASLIYIYKDRKPESFINDFNWIIKNNIPIKFPNCDSSKKLISKIFLPKVINLSIETFSLLNSYKVVISNSASSICVESAIAGCISINIGSGLGKLYNKFNIHQMTVKKLNQMKPKDIINLSSNRIHKEYLFNIEKSIKILTQ